MWYGKGPGVDRCGDVFKHANMAGSAPHGGVLVLAGDDHAAKSSTTAHQSEHILKACGIPVLYPSNVQEYLDYGLHGWAMSALHRPVGGDEMRDRHRRIRRRRSSSIRSACRSRCRTISSCRRAA